MPNRRHVGVADFAVASTLFFSNAQAQDSTYSRGLNGWREQHLANFDHMPLTRLELVFLQCSRESSRRMLSFDEAVPCAIAWDALLRRRFDGKVEALLVWWRTRRDSLEDCRPSDETACNGGS